MTTNDEEPWPGLSEDMMAERNRMLQLVTIDMERNTLDFGGSEIVDGDKYWIPISGLDSVVAFFKWMHHLSEKDWWTVDHARMFVERYEYLVRNEILPARFFPEVADEEHPDINELRALWCEEKSKAMTFHAEVERLRAEVAALKPQSNADEFASIPLRAWVMEVFQHLCHSPHTPDEWKRDLDKKTIALLNAIEQGKKGER